MRTAFMILLALATGCASGAQGDDGSEGGALDFPSQGGKTDAFGRALAGVAAPYEVSPALVADGAEERARTDMRFRRDTAWETVRKIVEPVPLLGLDDTDDSARSPEVPRFQTWYGIDDLKRMFQHLYESLGPDGRELRAPFGATELDEVFAWNARAIERTTSWPLERYLHYVQQLGTCPEGMPAEECAVLVQGKHAGATSGISRILYSPETVRAILASYDRVLVCLDELDQLPLESKPATEDNFSLCFHQELPADAVLVKAQWHRADFGKTLPVFDTDGAAMRTLLGGSANWGDGDRTADPGPDDIHTIRLRNGNVYRLVGLHVMTKELRHWQWATLWWSDTPDSDFGADRPASLTATAWPAFAHYKMCTVTWFDEEDPSPGARYAGAPTLADALDATGGERSWCSNPYIEHGRGNARTNCIGCHQHGGARVSQLDVIQNERLFPDNGRRQLREMFPVDYLWSGTVTDDWSSMLLGEARFFDHLDGR